MQEPLLVVVAGPTASGKSALAVALAEELNGEVISCDSVAVYCGMDIGSAKPSAAERARVTHHLIDVVNPDHPYTAGDYGRDARAAVANIHERGKTPIIAGGTGLYLRALLDGLSAMAPRDEALREELRLKDSAELHAMLTQLDPAVAARIHANDKPKILRAIEVCTLQGKPMSEAWEESQPEPLTGFRIVQIGLNPPREQLYERVNTRAAKMFSDGLVEETQTLIEQYGRDCRALTSLGYVQALALLEGALTREQAIAAAQQGHRNYAKRQMTWFRRGARMQWLEGFGQNVQQQTFQLLTSSF